MRVVLTTVFTSSKMKDMFGFMDEFAKQSVENLEQKVLEHAKTLQSSKTVFEMEWKDFFSRYGTDLIGSTAFGFEADSFRNPENEFYMSGMVIRNAFKKGATILQTILLMVLPKLAKLLGITAFVEKYNKYFTSFVEDTIRYREEKNIVRKDVIHILMEARKGKDVNEDGEPIRGNLPDLKDSEIAAQALIFYIGGFEKITSLLGFVAYELAINPDVQETLQQEIDEVYEKEKGFTYEGMMHQMQYLNMILKKTLRKWPSAGITDRAVTRTYTIPKTDTTPEVVLERGTSILVSIAGLQYFPNPHKFDPERFRDEKNTIKPFTYLPFGEISSVELSKPMRYALMEAKTIIVHILKNFTFVPGRKTQIPMKLSKNGTFFLAPEDRFWSDVTPRR